MQKGKVDLIGLCRPLLADPELPNKIASERLEDIRPCMHCLECYAPGQRARRCRVNAAIGEWGEHDIKPAEKKKRVLIVGSGPAGMEAARVAALRGHEVLLYEREHKLGGLLSLAAMIKGTEIEDLPALIRYFKTQMSKLGVKVRLGKESDLALVEEIKPDVVILAAGGIPTVPEIPGINRHNVVSSSDLHRKAKLFLRFFGPKVLRWLTKFYLPIGKRVVIMGGLIHGCEIAELLVKRGRKVTIVETSNQLGTGVPEAKRGRLISWLAKKGVTMLTEVTYEAITDKGLTFVREGQRETIEADTILIAVPPRANTELFKTLEGKVPEVYVTGDCKEPRLIVDAIEDGSRIGYAI
ncbi:Cinnamate reductase [subsurface metagenome]